MYMVAITAPHRMILPIIWIPPRNNVLPGILLLITGLGFPTVKTNLRRQISQGGNVTEMFESCSSLSASHYLLNPDSNITCHMSTQWHAYTWFSMKHCIISSILSYLWPEGWCYWPFCWRFAIPMLEPLLLAEYWGPVDDIIMKHYISLHIETSCFHRGAAVGVMRGVTYSRGDSVQKTHICRPVSHFRKPNTPFFVSCSASIHYIATVDQNRHSIL